MSYQMNNTSFTNLINNSSKNIESSYKCDTAKTNITMKSHSSNNTNITNKTKNSNESSNNKMNIRFFNDINYQIKQGFVSSNDLLYFTNPVEYINKFEKKMLKSKSFIESEILKLDMEFKRKSIKKQLNYDDEEELNAKKSTNYNVNKVINVNYKKDIII